VADFAELAIDTSIKWSGGSGRVFDFGSSDDECFYLAIDGESGKPILSARHKGECYRVAASEGILANRWARVRVEMDGCTASIFLDGKQVAKQDCALKPSMVFIPDRPEGNFIACGRDRNDFFKGCMDHFRIYRQVRDDFDALGPVPFALTQMQEWSEKDQERADEWEARKRAKEAELNAGKSGQLLDKIKWLERQKAALARTEKLDELEARAKEVERQKRDFDHKIHDQFRALPETGRLQQELDERRRKMDEIRQEIRQDGEYAKLTEEIRDCEARRREMEQEVRDRPALKALRAMVDAANQNKREAEQRIRQLPELKRILELSEQQQDGQKRREMLDQHNRRFQALRLSDREWQRADITRQRLDRQYHEALRYEIDAHDGRMKTERRLKALREKIRALESRLKAARPLLSQLEKSVRTKQEALDTRRRQFEGRLRAADDYKQAEAALAAARTAVEQEKRRAEAETGNESDTIADRIDELRTESKALRDAALRSARLFGPNPYPGRDTAQLQQFQQNLVYHTTVEWDYRTREEVSGKVTPKMKEWLLRVRGY
jgi:hypothetical protein